MVIFFFFSRRSRHTRLQGDWSSDVCSSDPRPPRRGRVSHDDRRLFVVRVAPPARVTAPDAGPFVAAALSVLRDARRVADGAEVSLGERPGAARSVVLPPADGALLGQANRALGSRGVTWRFGLAGAPGPNAAPGAPGLPGGPGGG